MDSFAKEVEFEDYCPWLEEDQQSGEEDKRVVMFGEGSQWVVVDEVGGSDPDEQSVEVQPEDVEAEDHKSKRRVRKLACPVCGERVSHSARHALAHHLPWFWGPSTACWECRDQLVCPRPLQLHLEEDHPDQVQTIDKAILSKLVKGFLQYLMQLLQFSTLEEMRDSLNYDKPLYDICKRKFLTNPDLDLCRSVDEEEPFRRTPVFTILDSDGNFSIYALLHWRVILHLLTGLTFEQQVRVRNFDLADMETPPAPEAYSVIPSPEAVSEASSDDQGMELSPSSPDSDNSTISFIQIADAHLHLDHLLNRVGIPDLQEFDLCNITPLFNTQLAILISNYCFPRLWPKREDTSKLVSSVPQLYFSFGIHPKTIQTTNEEILDEYLDTLEEIIKTQRTVAIGECGLDSSNTSTKLNLKRQITYFERQLELAVSKKLTVIVHCRGDTTLHFQLLDSLQKMCPVDHPIHWHCFSGIPHIYRQASSYFTNIVFGVTPHIFYKPTVSSFVQASTAQHLVLESDSPFIFYENQPGTPFHVNFVAEKISKTLDQSFNEIVQLTTANVKKIYQL